MCQGLVSRAYLPCQRGEERERAREREEREREERRREREGRERRRERRGVPSNRLAVQGGCKRQRVCLQLVGVNGHTVTVYEWAFQFNSTHHRLSGEREFVMSRICQKLQIRALLPFHITDGGSDTICRLSFEFQSLFWDKICRLDSKNSST